MWEITVTAHALLSLRGLKYGDWQPVWDFLEQTHGVPPPLGIDEAVDQYASSLETNQRAVPGRVDPTVFELIGDAHEIGLQQDHVARLAEIASRDDQHQLKLLEHATDNLRWDTREFDDWEEVIASDPSGRSVAPPVRQMPGRAPVSVSRWTNQLVEDGLTTTPPMPDVPRCSATGVGGGVDGSATRVLGRFEIEADVKDLVYATDPRHWPSCSWFFISMTEQGKPVPLSAPDDFDDAAYTGKVEEVVGLEDLLEVRTMLTTRFFVGADSVGMEFDLTPGSGGDGKVDVDHGYLLAERHPTEPGKLVVSSQKTFSFVGLNDLPFSFLCEFGWIDMMRGMAQCRAPGGTQ